MVRYLFGDILVYFATTGYNIMLIKEKLSGSN